MKKLSDEEVMELVSKHMSYCSSGYLSWKGKQFDRVFDPCLPIAKLRSYVERCLHLESNGSLIKQGLT